MHTPPTHLYLGPRSTNALAILPSLYLFVDEFLVVHLPVLIHLSSRRLRTREQLPDF
jgi:hypothetical protein